MNRVHIGDVAVDSGTLMISDPCYVLRHDIKFDPLAEYQKVIDNVESPCWSMINQLALGFGGFGGDGRYPVYGTYDELGLLRKVEIEFNPIK